MGADGVQMGTRFLATEESSASSSYKQAVIDAKQSDICIAFTPGSPCGMPFMVLRNAPMYTTALDGRREAKCDKGYLRLNNGGELRNCPAYSKSDNYFCICNGLLSSAVDNGDKEEPLYTVGANGYRIESIISVKNLMDELTDKRAAS